MPKPIRRSDRENRDFLRRFFASKKKRREIQDQQTDIPVGGINLLPEAEIVGERTQYEEPDLAASVLRGGALAAREAFGMVPIVGEALDVAEFNKIRKTGKDFYEDEADPTMYAAITAGGLLVPNLIERPARALGRAAQRFFKFGSDKLSNSETLKAINKVRPSQKVKAKAAPKEFKEVEEIMYGDNPNRVAQQRGTLNEAVDEIESLPSSRLREKARDLSHRARNINLYEGDIFSALEKGQVDNPFNMQAQRAAFEKFGLKSGDSGNTSRYFNWLSVRQPELVEQIAKGNDDALYRAMNDKSLADGFMNDAETAYRGVDMSSDNPNVRRAIKDPERIGERVSGEGVYTTRDPREAFSYATRDEPIRDVNEAGQEYFSGHRITRKGSVAEVQTDIDYDTPLDMIGQLDTKSLKGASIRDRSLPDGALSSIEGDHKIFMQGEGGAKFKIKQIIPQKDFKGLDMKFWGSMDFDPNLIDKNYFRNMSNNEAFKQAEAQFKSLRDVEIQKLRRLAKMYDVAGTVARATEAGIVVTAPTVAILKGSSYLNGDESTASDQKKFKVKKKAQEGMRVKMSKGGSIAMKKRPTGMSTIRK